MRGLITHAASCLSQGELCEWFSCSLCACGVSFACVAGEFDRACDAECREWQEDQCESQAGVLR